MNYLKLCFWEKK